MSKQLYKEISDIAMEDATVYSHLKMQKNTGSGDIETAIKLIRILAQEKSVYLKLANDTAAMSLVPTQPFGEGAYMTTPTPNNQDDELRRIYKCIWFDFSDGVNREEMWLKEFKKLLERAVIDAKIEQVEQLKKRQVFTSDVDYFEGLSVSLQKELRQLTKSKLEK